MFTSKRWWPRNFWEVTEDWRLTGMACPFLRCGCILGGGWMMRHHFWDVHLMDSVKIPKEGKFHWCRQCRMQVDPQFPCHPYTKKCQVGVERGKQQEAAVTSALALWQQFSVHGDVLEQVDLFKYLGRLLVQDDDDIWVIRAQLRKAQATWACIGQVLRAKNVPHDVAKFYKAVVQAIGKPRGVPHPCSLSHGEEA
jgi:hypothetical protein